MKNTDMKQKSDPCFQGLGCRKIDGDWEFLMELDGILAHNQKTHDVYQITWTDLKSITELMEGK